MNRLKVKEYLLSCPFCGGNADAIVFPNESGIFEKCIKCNDCNSRTKNFTINSNNQDMIKVWNSRI